jgi:hypothetical protein
LDLTLTAAREFTDTASAQVFVIDDPLKQGTLVGTITQNLDSRTTTATTTINVTGKPPAQPARRAKVTAPKAIVRPRGR